MHVKGAAIGRGIRLALLVVAATGGLATAQEHIGQAAVDYAHERFQPAYLAGRVVQFEQRGPSPDGMDQSDIQVLYEVEYPNGWRERLARPLCTYCDHNGDGENAWDYHDHVLDALPDREQNDAGEVYWHVLHVLPAYIGEPSKDAEISAAYAEKLPAQSGEAVRDLIGSTLADGTPIAEVIDTHYVFTAPLIRP